MSKCPRNSQKEELSKLFNYDEINLVTSLNNGIVPSKEKATELLKNRNIQNPDDYFNYNKNSYKLKKIREQRTLLEKRMTNSARMSIPQIETLEKLQKITNSAEEFYLENERLGKENKPMNLASSVSKFILSPEFKGDQAVYEKYRIFGNFMHELLENVQNESTETRRSATSILTREYFNEKYNKLKNTGLQIENLDENILYEQALNMISNFSFYANQGAILLPEITVLGKSAEENDIVGRLDLLVLNTDGTVNILDYKTKKVTGVFTKDGQMKDDVVHAALSVQRYPVGHPVSGEKFGEGYRETGDRTIYDSWMLQLDAYGNLLEQAGIEIKNKDTVVLVYDVSETGPDENRISSFNNAKVITFNNHDYYDKTLAHVGEEDENVITRRTAGTAKIETIRRITDKEIPVKGKIIEEEETIEESKVYDFSPSNKNMEYLISKLDIFITGQLESINKDLKKLKESDANNESAIELLNIRKKSLYELKRIVERKDISSESKVKNVNFFTALDIVYEDLNMISEITMKDIEHFRKIKDYKNKKWIGENIRKSYHKATSMNVLINAIDEIVNEASENEENNITEDSPIRKKLSSIYTSIGKINAAFAESSMVTTIEVLKSVGDKVFEKMVIEKELALAPEIAKLKKELEALKNGENLKGIAHYKGILYSYISKINKNNFLKAATYTEAAEFNRVLDLEKKIMLKENALNGLKFTDEALSNYIDGVTDPESLEFIGSDGVFSEQGIVAGQGLDVLIASASNSEIGVAAPVLLMKAAVIQASYNATNSPEVLIFDTQKRKLLRKYSQEQLNDKVSSWRNIDYYDAESNSIKSKREFRLESPYSEEYENKYNSFDINKRILKKNHDDAMSYYDDVFADYDTLLRNGIKDENKKKDLEEAKQAVLEIKRAINKNKDEEISWMLENATLPYTEEFYRLQQALPTEIRDQIQELYFEKEILIESFGGDNMLLEDNKFDELEAIDIEINKLKLKAKKENPEYEAYLEKFNDLYEFNINDDYFDRMHEDAKSKYGVGTEEYEKWLRRNTVERPTAEWYEEREILQQKRADIYLEISGENPNLDLLYKMKRDILFKYKINGRLHPQVMTKEDIIKYENIQNEIETEQNKARRNSKITDEEKAKLKKINAEIKLFETKVESPHYRKEFETRLADLEANLANLHTAKLKYDNSRKTEKDAREYEVANDMFEKNEAEFKEWFELNHVTKYVSITNPLVSARNNEPKGFNYESMPTQDIADKYMKRVPVSSKYYSIRTLRKENWYLDGRHLHSTEIASLKKDNNFNINAEIASKRLVIKEGVYNPDFKNPPGKILMPKAIKTEDNNLFTIIDKSSDNVNKKFIDIKEDNDIREFYDNMSSMFFNLQKNLEGKKTGYMVPGASATMVERIARGESISKSIKEQFNVLVDRSFKVKGSEFDIVENSFGDLGRNIAMRGTTQMSEGLQSEDAISSIMKYTVEAHNNIALQEVAPQVEGYIDMLKYQLKQLDEMIAGGKSQVKDKNGNLITVDMKKRRDELERIISINEFEKRKYLYGQSDNIRNRALKKQLSNLFSYTSFIRIGFSLTNQIKNNIAGNVQIMIGSGSEHYSMKDFALAKKRIYAINNGVMANYFADYGKISDIHLSTMLYRFFDPKQEGAGNLFEGIGGTAARKRLTVAVNLKELGYFFQDKGESEVNATTMFAIFNNYRFKVFEIDKKTGEKVYKKDDEGNIITVPVDEIYIKGKNGELTRRSDVDYTDEDEKMMHNIIYREINRQQGNYAKRDQTKAEDSLGGKMLFYFRKFLIPMMLNRFGYLRPSWETGQVSVGYWRALVKSVKYFGAGKTALEFILGTKALTSLGYPAAGIQEYYTKNGKKKESSFYKKSIVQARNDAVIMTLLTTLSMMALSFVRKKRDKDEELSALMGNTLRVLWGVKGEAVSMMPIGGGSDEYIRNFTTAIPVVREFQKINKSIGHIYNYGMAMLIGGGLEPDETYDSNFYINTYRDAYYLRKSGPFEKGDPKLMKDFVDLTGIRNFRDIFNPNNVIKELSKRQ